MLGLCSAKDGNMEYVGNANQWADKRKNVEQFSYDADEAAEKWLREEGEALLNRDGESSTGSGVHMGAVGDSSEVSISMSAKL